LGTTESQAAKDTILRAWKDEEFRMSLPEDVRREIPARPMDGVEGMSDEQLEAAAGAGTPTVVVALKVGGSLFGRAAATKAGEATGLGVGGLITYGGGKATGIID
jgi:mersacidin/lichenicidin family type 2 lantibiotic